MPNKKTAKQEPKTERERVEQRLEKHHDGGAWRVETYAEWKKNLGLSEELEQFFHAKSLYEDLAYLLWMSDDYEIMLISPKDGDANTLDWKDGYKHAADELDLLRMYNNRAYICKRLPKAPVDAIGEVAKEAYEELSDDEKPVAKKATGTAARKKKVEAPVVEL